MSWPNGERLAMAAGKSSSSDLGLMPAKHDSGIYGLSIRKCSVADVGAVARTKTVPNSVPTPRIEALLTIATEPIRWCWKSLENINDAQAKLLIPCGFMVSTE